ncbi:MAG TPA: hypothetical protein VE172_19985 [Stackebrandtia sp.]|jgi:DNA-binding protein YbaB|uniref:hypothetical protein n=1 Tax=Stackebrandtia sp. TaxID=2023065 RepID=UPI002D273846|nr:hypothetical protein [Stackebrandtia sp.]HZE41085.1 hypothetical protein [Stackebrandtia sp.]
MDGYAAKLREVEEHLARLRGARERMVAVGVGARQLDAELGTDTHARSSDDGLAIVACDGQGRVRRVELDGHGYDGVDDERLCAAVLQARRRARRVARAEARPGE